MRRVILGTLVVCLVVAMAPWLSGGQLPVAMLVSGAALLLGALLAWRQPAVRQFKAGPLMVSWLVLMGWGSLSLLWTVNRFSSAVWLVSWLMAGLAFRLAYTAAGEARGWLWLTRGYLGSAAVFCGVAIWMYLTGTYDRLTGTFYWANPAAAYLIPAIVLSWEGMRKAIGRAVYGWGSLVVLFVASFLLTDSRGAGLVLLFVGGLYLLIMPTPKRFWITFLFSMVVAVGVTFGLSNASTLVAHEGAKVAPGSRVGEVVSGQSNSIQDRIYFAQSAVEVWFDRPLQGSGAGTYGDIHPQYQQRVVSASNSAHNLYLEVLAELGIVGAMALGAVLLWLLAGVIRGVVAEPGLMVAALGLAGLLMHFGLDIDAGYPALLMLAAVLAGVVYRRRSSEQQVGASWRWVAVAALVMVPLAGLYQSSVAATRAMAAQDDGDLAAAAAWYNEARRGLVTDPDYIGAEGIALYGVAAGGGVDAGRAAGLALERAREAEGQDPRDGQHHQLEGRVLALQGKRAEAEVAFRAALALDRFNHPDYALDLATVLLAQGKQAEALQTAQTMLGQYPAEVVANRSNDVTVKPALANLEALVGNVYLARGQVNEAAAAADRALVLDPQNLRARALKHQVEQRH